MPKEKTQRRAKVHSQSGFTLIELLVVIAIIAVLAALILAALSSAQKGARDSQRLNDMKQYAAALEGYAGDNSGQYPTTNTSPDWRIPSGGIAGLVPSYMKSAPAPPPVGQYAANASQQNYYYAFYDPSDGKGKRWLMCAWMERKNQWASISKTGGVRYGACDWSLAD